MRRRDEIATWIRIDNKNDVHRYRLDRREWDRRRPDPECRSIACPKSSPTTWVCTIYPKLDSNDEKTKWSCMSQIMERLTVDVQDVRLKDDTNDCAKKNYARKISHNTHLASTRGCGKSMSLATCDSCTREKGSNRRCRFCASRFSYSELMCERTIGSSSNSERGKISGGLVNVIAMANEREWR